VDETGLGSCTTADFDINCIEPSADSTAVEDM
jgi:hypothetical protein